MRFDTIKFERLEHNFFHVKNQWILIGKGSLKLDRQLLRIVKKDHQKIHWFVDNPEWQMNAFNVIAFHNALLEGDRTTELFIHVPKYAKTDLPKVKQWFDDEAQMRPYMKILCEKHGTSFSMSEHYDERLSVIFNHDSHMIETKVWLGASWDNMTGLNDYVVPKADHKAHEPSKDTQIARFKGNTPMVIMKSFKDEEDIWRYLQAEKQVQETPRTITIRVGDKNEANGAMDVIAGTIADALHIPMSVLKLDEKNKNGRTYHLDQDAVAELNRKDETSHE